MNKLRHFWYVGYPLVSRHCAGISGTNVSPQSSTHSFNWSRTVVAVGRFFDAGPSSATQVATNDSHNTSEIPSDGLSGRSPWMTLYITASVLLTSLNGRRPVRTYREVGQIFLRAETCTHLEDCHPDCVDIRAHGGKVFQKLASKPELFRKH